MEQPKQRILVVDDDLSLSRCLKLGLETRGGYEVHDESSGFGALAAARTFRPDLILMDICMPDADGGTVAAQIRADPHLKYTPIVFLTSLVSPEEESANGLQSAGFRFLAKPLDLAKVIGCIREYLGPAPVADVTALRT